MLAKQGFYGNILPALLTFNCCQVHVQFCIWNSEWQSLTILKTEKCILKKNPVAFFCFVWNPCFLQVRSVFITSENVSRPSYSIWLPSIIPKETATHMSPCKEIGRKKEKKKSLQRRNGLDIAVTQGGLSALPVENFIACLLRWNLSLTLPTASQDVDVV